MKGTLSVIVPVYNVEKYLRRALDSILRQTYSVYEVICVDDGSQDTSLEILNEYAKKDSRIRVIHKANGGLVSARKTGILEARGEYVTYVDSDDYVEHRMYEEMMNLAVKYSADLVTSGLIRNYGNSSTINDEKISAGVYINNQIRTNILGFLINKNSFYETSISPSVCNKIFRTSKLRHVQMCVDDRITVGEDDAVTYPFLFRSNIVVVSGKSYYNYCIREMNSIMGMQKTDDLKSIEILFQYLEKEFRNADSKDIELIKQFQILKTYFLLLRYPTKVLSYDGKILYPFGKINKEKDKILLYGAGKFGIEMEKYLQKQGFQIVAWADKSVNRPDIIRPCDIKDVDFDCILITVLIADAVEHIRRDLKMMEISDAKILFVDTKIIKQI